MENFIKVNKNILETKDSKYITSILMFNQYINRNSDCVFTTEKLIKDCGCIPKYGSGKSVEKFKSIIKYCIDNNILNNCNISNINRLNINTGIYCTYNPKFNKKDGNDIDFISFPVNLLNNIMIISNKNRCDLIYIMLYLISFMNKNNKYCYPSIDNIKDVTGFSKNKILKLINILKENNLIYVDNIGLCSKNGEFKTFNNVYALDTCNLDKGLLQSRAYAKAQGYNILNKRQIKIYQQINGLKGKINQLNKVGGDTKELKEKLKQLKNKLNDKCNMSIDDLNKKIDILNKKCDELGIDGADTTGIFDENELEEIIEFLENSINRVENKNK